MFIVKNPFAPSQDYCNKNKDEQTHKSLIAFETSAFIVCFFKSRSFTVFKTLQALKQDKWFHVKEMLNVKRNIAHGDCTSQ